MRRAQPSRRPLVIAAGVGLAIGSMVVTGPAGAADPDLVEEALATLGIDDVPAGLVDDIASLLPDDLGAEADGDTDAATRLEEAVRNWEIVAPEWRDVPEGLMAQVRECRDEVADDPVDDGEPTETTIAEGDDDVTETTIAEGDDDAVDATADGAVEECGEQLRVRLRVEHAERLVARFTERIAEAEGLPEQARAEVIAAMTAVRDRAEQRLRDIVESDDDAVDAVLEATGRDRAVLARVQEQVAEQAGELNRRSEQANTAPGRGSDPDDTADTDGTDAETDDGGTSDDDPNGDRNGDDSPGQGDGTANTTVPERPGGQGGDAGDDAGDAGDDDRGNSGDAPGRTTVVDERGSDSDDGDDPQDSDGRSEGRPDDNGRGDEEGNGR